MKKIAIAVFALWLAAGCGSSEKPAPDASDPVVQQEVPEPKTSRDERKFGKTAESILEALRTADYATLDKYVEDNVYVIYSGAGAYPDFVAHPSMSAVAEDQNLTEPMRYLLQALSSVGGSHNSKVPSIDLSEFDPCEASGSVGFYGADEVTTTVLTTTYKQLQENLGEEGQAPIFTQLLDAESKITMQLMVNTGEEADFLYFAPSGDSWRLVAIDVRECGL